MSQLEFEPLSWPLAVALGGLLLAALGAVYVSYLGRLAADAAELSRRRRMLLSVLRLSSIGLLLLLALEPVITRQLQEARPAEVAVLIDDSQSLLAAGDTTWVRRNRAAALRTFEAAIAEQGGRARFFRLADGASPLASPDSLNGRARATDLATGLRQMHALMSTNTHVATLLLSDGISTVGADARYALHPTEPPIISVLLGDSSRRRDLRLRPLLSNGVATRQVATPIRAEISCDNAPPGTSVELSLRENGRVLQRQRVSIDPSGAAHADFTYTPAQAGLVIISITASALPGESNLRNNQQRLTLRVLENRINVLLLGERPHPDLGAIRNALAADARIELVERIKWTAADPASPALTPEIWARANVVICHGLPSDAATREQLATSLARQPLGLALILGPTEDPAALTRLAAWLPATPRSVRSSLPLVAQISLTDAGRSHATYSFDADFDRWLADTPPLQGPDATWQLAPTATVLATARVQGLELEAPLFLAAEQQQRRQLMWLGQGLWRQRTEAFALRGSTQDFDTWWQNQVAWLAASRDLRRFSVTPLQAAFEGDEPVVLRGRVLDERNSPVSDASVTATVRDSAGRERQVELIAKAPGTYTADIAGLAEGLYSYTAVGTHRGQRVGTDRGQFVVAAVTAEYQRLRADVELMRQLAQRTGGRFVPQPDLAQAARDVLAVTPLSPRLIERQAVTPLAHTALALIVLLALMAAEWVLRKRWGLL